MVNQDQNRKELVAQGNELRVVGRGTSHQVDVLGEFLFTPPFSLPVRLFLEAKHHASRCDLPVVRNAHGLLDDVNQNYVHDHRSSRPRRRYQYCYALFSMSGFTREAQDFGIAHQISLVDLSGTSFTWLRDAVSTAGTELRGAAEHFGIGTFPVAWMRTLLRRELRTAPHHLLPNVSSGAQLFRQQAERAIDAFVSLLESHAQVELLLGFPSAPFILPLATSDKAAFLRYLAATPRTRCGCEGRPRTSRRSGPHSRPTIPMRTR